MIVIDVLKNIFKTRKNLTFKYRHGSLVARFSSFKTSAFLSISRLSPPFGVKSILENTPKILSENKREINFRGCRFQNLNFKLTIQENITKRMLFLNFFLKAMTHRLSLLSLCTGHI